MSSNIVSAVTQFLTPEIISKVASASGIVDRGAAQNAIQAAVPAVLAGMAGLASKAEGAERLAGAISQQSPRMLDNLGSTIAGSSQFAETGKNLLSSLFGNASFGSLANIIARYAGMGEGSARSLLGMLAPMVLGVLGREAGSGANGLTQLLASQKDNIMAALPPGVANLLRTTGLPGMESLTGAAAGMQDAARSVRDSVGSMAHTTPSAAPSSSNWAYWVIPLLAVVGLAAYLLSGDRADHGPTLTQAPVVPAPADADVDRQVGSAINAVNITLIGVNDRATALAALVQLKQGADELARLRAIAMRLPPETRAKVAEVVKAQGARLAPALERVSNVPDLPTEMRPAVIALIDRLDDLVTTPTGPTR